MVPLNKPYERRKDLVQFGFFSTASVAYNHVVYLVYLGFASDGTFRSDISKT